MRVPGHSAENAEFIMCRSYAVKDKIGAAIEVPKALGSGLLESADEECLCRELALGDVPFKSKVAP